MARVDTLLQSSCNKVSTGHPRPDGLLDVRWLEHLDGGDTVTYSQWSGAAEVDGGVAYRRYRVVPG
jgi:hypothetical protein